MKLSEALTKYIAFGQFKNKPASMSTYYTHIRLLCLYFKNCDIEQVNIGDIIEHMKIMREVGWDNNTFTPKCSAWKQFFDFFRKQGYKVLDPALIPIPQREYHFPKIIEQKDLKKLLAALEKHPQNIHRLKNMAALKVLFDTGVRLGEFRSMKVKDIDTEKMRTIIKTEKAKGVKPVRMVFWTKETNKLLKEYIRAREYFLKQKKFDDKEDWLWISAHGTWGCGKQWGDTAIEAMLKRLSLEANLGFTANPHRFRHHFGRKLALQGANNSVISDMMGHANIESTHIYTVMNPEMMDDTYRKHFKA